MSTGKWNPFSAVINGNKNVDFLEQERNKIDKPILSSDKLEELNDIIISAHKNKNTIIVKYYYNGYIYYKEGTISKINSVDKSITINSKTLYINQIIDIKEN